MSYNAIKVNTKTPNSSGDIDLNLGDLITISSPGSGQLLQKKSSNWGTDSPLTAVRCDLNWMTKTSYNVGTYNYDIEDNYIWRHNGGEITEAMLGASTSSGSYVPVSTAAWYMSFNVGTPLAPGYYWLLRAVVGPTRSSGSSLKIQWRSGSGALNTTTAIGPVAYSTEDFGATCYGLLPTDNNTHNLTLKIIDKTGTIGLHSYVNSFSQQLTAQLIKRP